MEQRCSNMVYEATAVTRDPDSDLKDCRIRLLWLDLDAENLSGALKAVSLLEAPQFIATSYVWGDHEYSGQGEQRPDWRILCTAPSGQSQAMPLGRSCYDMLQCIRRRRVAMPLWVDAICINQADAEERASQVSFMGSIYSGAASVIIWVGDSTPATHDAIKFVRDIWRPREQKFEADTGYLKIVRWLTRHYVCEQPPVLSWPLTLVDRTCNTVNMIYDQTWDFKGQGYGLRALASRCSLDYEPYDFLTPGQCGVY